MKDQNDPIVSQNEITSLNLADLDVQELENRLELAVLAAAPDSGEEQPTKTSCWGVYKSDSSVSSISSN